MKTRFPLFSKVLLLSLINLSLIVAVLAFIVRVQFRTDARSFLLAPAQDRIMAVSHVLAMELDDAQPGQWNALLAQYSKTHGVSFHLFDERGDPLAGESIELPREVLERIPRRGRRRDDEGEPQRAPRTNPGRPAADRPAAGNANRERRPPQPPLFLMATAGPTRYWAGVRIPIRREAGENPKPGTLVLMTNAGLVAGNLFFDLKPWLGIVLAVIAVSLVVWLPFIRGLTRSISQMTTAAERIAQGQFEVHVQHRRRDELGQLGEAINRMAERLAGYLNAQKQFLGGIAHELCNPISTIQFGLGNLERRVPDSQRATVADIQEDVAHMSGLVNELLSFSREGMRALEPSLSSVNVASIVENAIGREDPGGARVEHSVDKAIHVQADEQYLTRAVSNVLRNAIRYAADAGPIRISAERDGAEVVIAVADSGPGVPDSELDAIFAPFYRTDTSRSQETGGVGLGLAIVRNSIESCGGTVRATNIHPSGLRVEIRLPAAPTEL